MIIDLIVKLVLSLVSLIVEFIPKFEFDYGTIYIDVLYIGDIFALDKLVALMSTIVTFETGFLIYRVVRMIINLIRGSGS